MNSLQMVPKQVIDALQKQLGCKEYFDYQSLIIEKESKEYSACRFIINKKLILFRKSKITPTKVGQFVTLYKRNINKTITPFDISDAIDYVVVMVSLDNKIGQFVFPETVLLDKGIFSTSIKEGKRAIRVYPPWNVASNKQATTTQNWQLNYFIEV